MLDHYYNQEADHDYMNVERCDPIIFDFLEKLNLKDSAVLEIGSGFGRYTHALADLAKNVIASEPNDHMYSKLKENYQGVSNVQIIQEGLEELIQRTFEEPISYIVLVHVLHHLPQKLFGSLRTLTDQLQAKLVIIEPNHINPLFFCQIFVTKNMRFADEKGMFVNNSKQLFKAHFNSEFSFDRKFIGLFPPSITKSLIRMSEIFMNSTTISTEILNPFSAYSVMIINKP